MKDKSSKSLFLLVIVVLVVLFGLYQAGSQPSTQTALSTPTEAAEVVPPEAAADIVTGPADPPPRNDPEPEPTDPGDDALDATQPKQDDEWEVLRERLVCDVEPALSADTVQGTMHLVTWPGPDHEAQEGGLSYPAIPSTITIEDGGMTGDLFLPAMKSSGTPVRHVAKLTIPGFAPTEFSFLTYGPGEDAECTETVQLDIASSGVVGSVSLPDGSPVSDAIVAGCNTRAVSGSDGDYFLLPRSEGTCTLRARHAPGSSTQSAPQEIDLNAAEDLVADFVIEIPDHPTPGVTLTRDENDQGETEVLAQSQSPDDPWAKYLLNEAIIMRVGDVPASTMSDEELWRAMETLDQVIHVQQQFDTEAGERLLVNHEVTEL